MFNIDSLRSSLGQWVYGKVFTPSWAGASCLKFDGDYGNGFLYEEIFSGNGADVRAALKIAGRAAGEVLDAGGGKGRVSAAIAKSGICVTLVDCSQYMTEAAKRHRSILPPAAKERWTILRNSLEHFSLKKKFDIAFAINSVLEHFETDDKAERALCNISKHLTPTGFLYLDVHHTGCIERTEQWLTGRWRYNFDRKIAENRYRIWQRTYAGMSKGLVVCEQAFSKSFGKFLVSRQHIRILSPDQWINLFRRAGFKIYGMWGNWSLDPVSHQLPKLVFKLGRT